MACSKYEYVKKFEEKTIGLPQTFIVVRIDVFLILNREKDSLNFVVYMTLRSQMILELLN